MGVGPFYEEGFLASEIGVLNEKPLHAALKSWCARPGDRLEEPVGGYVVDIARPGLFLEVQTGGFSSMRSKVRKLCRDSRLRLVYPVALEKWLLKLPKDGARDPVRRKSPKRGRIEEVFAEMVSFPELIAHANFSVEVLLVRMEEVRSFDGRRGWRRRGWLVEERRLLEVAESRLLDGPEAWLSMLPDGMPEEFTTRDIAEASGVRRWLAQKMAYCLRKAGLIGEVGRSRSGKVYRLDRDGMVAGHRSGGEPGCAKCP